MIASLLLAGMLSCTPVSSHYVNTIVVTGLCPQHVRVELAEVIHVTSQNGEIVTVAHDVPMETVRARHGIVRFANLRLGWAYEWRTIIGHRFSPWTIVRTD